MTELLVPRGMSTGSFVEERDDWERAVERARREGWAQIELCAIRPALLATLADHLAESPLDGFERVSVHAPVGVASTDDAIAQVAVLPLDSDVILHPDLYGETAEVDRLGQRAVFENMDIQKRFGQTPGDLAAVFERFPAAGFCLDVAHVWTVDRSLDLGHDLLDAFGSRLRQLHVSGIEPDGTHRPTTHADLELYQPLLERSRGVPWVLESVLAG